MADEERIAEGAGESKNAYAPELLDVEGFRFLTKPDADKANLTEKKAMALMLAQPSMIKSPVLEVRGKLLVGFKPENYAAVVG